MKNNDNNFEWTEELIQHHLDNKDYQKLNIKDEHGNTGFIVTCLDKPELAKIMLEKHDIDFNIQDKYGRTGFIWACINQPELAKIMLKKDNIDFNIQDKYGLAGFIMACEFQPELAEIMLEKDNINFNIQDKMGYTGFMLVCLKQSILLDKMLNNDNQIHKTLKNKDGLTGYDLAKEENPESFEIYKAWLENNNILNQVQKRSKRHNQHL